MKRRKIANKMDASRFENAREALEKALPHQNIRKAFYVRNQFAEADVFPEGMRSVADGATVEIRGDKANLRVYRHSDEAHLRYDIDERTGVNQESVENTPKHMIENHHTTDPMEEDMMARNHVTVEFVPNGEGGLKPNVGPDGMMPAYINFPDPMEELRREMEEKRKGTQS